MDLPAATKAFEDMSGVLQYGVLGLCFFMAAGMMAILGFWMYLGRDRDRDKTASDRENAEANRQLARALQSLADATDRQGSAIGKLQVATEDTNTRVVMMERDLEARVCCASNAALKALQEACPNDWQSRLVKAQAAGA